MARLLEVGAFAALIGGQFLGVLFTISMRETIYPPEDRDPGAEDAARLGAGALQHAAG